MSNSHETQKMQNIASPLDKKQKNLYRYEQGGMLVYDIRAELFKMPSNSIPLPLFPESANQSIYESNFLNTQENEILEKIKQLPPSPQFSPSYNLYIPDDSNTLTFNSKFESGNLLRAIKLSDYEYNLTIRSDMNSIGNNHWYYFSVTNPRKTPVTFHILNMKKCDGLYKLGMKPAVYSTSLFHDKKTGWHRDCSNVSYKLRSDSLAYYTLTFTYSFKYKNDLVYFAYAVPYTYTHLNNYLESIQAHHPSILRIDTLCNSLANNTCRFLTITNNVHSYKPHKTEESDSVQSFQSQRLKSLKKRLHKNNKEHKMKKGIFLTARVHSGETVSSFTIQGCIDFLLSSSPEAVFLRDHFIFKIVPMLNPDGVRYGNYRCSLLGVDLNRRWNFPNKNKHPTIFYTKKLLQEFSSERRVMLYCDFHGHTKKQNVFMYGCAEHTNDLAEKRRNLCVRTFPVLMQSNKFFSFKDCNFGIHPSKISTARVVVFRELRVLNSYTVEASFFGAKGVGGAPDCQMEPADYASIGQTLCELLPMFLSNEIFFKKVKLVSEFLMQPSKLDDKINVNFIAEDLKEGSQVSVSGAFVGFEEAQWENIQIPEIESASDSSGSESNPEERQELVIRNSKSTKKTRVSPSSIYKSPERRALYTKLELKPLNLSKRYNSITKTSHIPKILEEPKPSNIIEKNKSTSQYKLANRVNILLESPLKNAKKSPLTKIKPPSLPKINTENKISAKFSPRGLNIINYSWVEEYSHSIFSSINFRK